MKSIQKKTTKRHCRGNIKYHDILTHDNRHQLFLISPIPTPIQVMIDLLYTSLHKKHLHN